MPGESGGKGGGLLARVVEKMKGGRRLKNLGHSAHQGR